MKELSYVPLTMLEQVHYVCMFKLEQDITKTHLH